MHLPNATRYLIFALPFILGASSSPGVRSNINPARDAREIFMRDDNGDWAQCGKWWRKDRDDDDTDGDMDNDAQMENFEDDYAIRICMYAE
ncbi:Uu.00g034700.m01.CDS01 [Anthostomella pinea]|uniref:Uu.00g034700.m01.CDS01 n=1 Tax=Anthostomella pinea TaxID=933095 RepID=A0AAI8V9L3_9PEZI|nr:Uu.00g034700.m01.CDS01 [Anthostomella pinea]